MARRGWVSAEVAPGTWRRLMVFDDGWVELPGFGRTMSDTRRNLRRSLTTLGVFLGAVLLGAGLDSLGAPEVLSVVCAVVALAALLYGGFLATAARWRGFRQSSDDADQARRERAEGLQVGVAPGARRWRRTRSARELADGLTGVRLVTAASLVAAEATVEGDDHVVVVRLADGAERTLRSPDAKLPRLVLPLVGPA